MSRELKFIFPLENGLHARPASFFRNAANRFRSTLTLTNHVNHATANAKSTLALVATLTNKGDSCSISITGEDEQDAFEAMKSFIDSDFPHCDDELAAPSVTEVAGSLPRSLKMEGTLVYRGTAVSKGIVFAHAFIANSEVGLPDVSRCPKGPVAEEVAKIERAFHRVVEHIRSQLALSDNKTQQEIVTAHLSIAEDTEFRERVLELVRGQRASAGEAVVTTTEYFTKLLQQSGSVYLRERILDIKDIARMMIHELYGLGNADHQVTLKSDGIWISENLSPSQFIALDKAHLKGIVLSQGGTTSHTVILARAFGIPCITGAIDIHLRLRTGQDIIVDAERGIVVPDPSAAAIDFYRNEMSRLEAQRAQLVRFKDIPGATADGKRLEIGANVGSYEEATAAFQNGAEGIGLFRTELLFMNRTSPPDEEEQFKAYAETARLSGKRGVIIRTLDIGGDKPASYLSLPPETNPFLGFRAVRMYEAHAAIITTQLRAILRASVFGNLKIMIPMVSTVAEIRAMRQWIHRVMDGLEHGGIPFNKNIEIGIMVEIPSVGFIVDQLSREADFFSIGSNDLTQYFLAVDRDNEKVGHLYDSFHPSFLRFLKTIIDDIHAHKKWVGLCGELGANKL
ncbi:MAG TPA: phosphoenolpyruvate--protein phosphotransferase, partial [Bacteroidota bacterium]